MTPHGSATENVVRQYLTFGLDRELFGVAIGKVREVLELGAVTKVPGTPDLVRGVIDLRGNVVPVVDMRLKLGLERKIAGKRGAPFYRWKLSGLPSTASAASWMVSASEGCACTVRCRSSALAPSSMARTASAIISEAMGAMM